MLRPFSLIALILAVASLVPACADDASDSPGAVSSAGGGAGSGGGGTGGNGGGGSGGSGFPQKDWAAEADKLLQGPDAYRHSVFYEVFVRSYQDTNGDGLGDLQGLTSRLDYLKELGVDGLWLMPIMPTPFHDSGYDVADYTAINPDYGTMADFDQLLAEAKKRNIRVVIDLVLNHTSNEHAWFQESRSSKDNPKASWYVWSDTPSDPNIGCGLLQSTFGTSAWELDPVRNQYYYHRFYKEQPDLDYRNPEVVQATLDAARFWLDKGVDGFRCDVIALLVETKDACQLVPETVAYIQKLRALLDEYPDRMMVAEPTNFETSADYFGNGKDMFHMTFNFSFGYFWGQAMGAYSDTLVRDSFDRAQKQYPAGAQDALVIGSHDVVRAYSSAKGQEWRYRRAAEIQLTMRGTPFVYYGEELGLRPTKDKVVDFRDSARAPMPWTSGGTHGFTTGTPWIDFGADSDLTSVEVEAADKDSMLSFYKGLLALRRGHAVWGTGELKLLDPGTDKLLVYVRENEDEAYAVVVSFDEEPHTGTVSGAAFPSAGERVWGDAKLTVEGDSAVFDVPASGSGIFRLR
jgi:alpha-glucosidase